MPKSHAELYRITILRGANLFGHSSRSGAPLRPLFESPSLEAVGDAAQPRNRKHYTCEIANLKSPLLKRVSGVQRSKGSPQCKRMVEICTSPSSHSQQNFDFDFFPMKAAAITMYLQPGLRDYTNENDKEPLDFCYIYSHITLPRVKQHERKHLR